VKKLLFVVVLFLCLLASNLFAQTFAVSLSPKHASKLNSIKTGHKRLVRYYKYYKKDSTHHIRKEDKRYRHILDSAYRSDAVQAKYLKQLREKGLPIPVDSQLRKDTLMLTMNRWYKVLRDSTTSDSVRQVAKQKVKALVVEKARQYPGFEHLMDRYQLQGDSIGWESLSHQIPGVDTLASIFNSSPDELFNTASQEAEKKMSSIGRELIGGEISQAEALTKLPGKYVDEYGKYLDRDSVKNEVRERAASQAAEYFAGHADKLQGAQARLSKLLSKYREFSNPDDLSSAVKRTSMDGKTFWEHLLVGGNFNIVSTTPVSVDFSPQLGYKFNTNFAVGLGMNYRFSFSDSIRNSWYVSPSNTSFKVFANYDVIKGFFAIGEWEKSGIKEKSNDKFINSWKDNYFLGVGRKFLVHPKVFLTVTALYNLNPDDNNPVYPRRFQVRTGFQLSELATRKKKTYYNVNR
jgi:hypothetical protein